jgi:hypothetical protein
MKIIPVFIICIIVILFYMYVLSKRKKVEGCACGKGNCQTGTPCEDEK